MSSSRTPWRVISQSVKISDVNWIERSFVVSTEIFFVILDATLERFDLQIGQDCLLPCELGNVSGTSYSRGYVRINGQDVAYRRQLFPLLTEEPDFYGYDDLMSTKVDTFGSRRSLLQIDLPFTIINSLENEDNARVITCSLQVVVRKPQTGVQFNCCFGKDGELLPGAHLFTYKTGVVTGTSSWLPCLDSLNQLSVWRFEFDLPPGLTGIAPGEISESVSDEKGKRTSYELRVPATPENIGFVVGHFSMHQNPDVNEIECYALPRLMNLVKHTVQKSDRNIEFFEELLSCRFPYFGYKQVFVDGIPDEVTSYCGLSIFSVNILYSKKILDVVQSTRYLLAYGIAEQFFGCFVSVNDWSDMWLVKGLAGFITGLYIERHFGTCEYLFQIRKLMNSVCDYESRWGKIAVRPTYRGKKPPTPPEGAEHKDFSTRGPTHFDPNSAHSSSTYYAQILFKKAHLVMRMLQRRLGVEPFNQVLQKIVSVAVQAWQHVDNVPDWDHMLLDTEAFFRNVSNVTGHELPTFLEQWVYDGGHVYFEIAYSFNRKRNIIELELRQEADKNVGRMSYVGPLNIIVQELDGFFTHPIQIDADISKHDLQCHSKGRRQKRKKIPLSNGDEIEVELSSTDNESPVLWIRVDPDHSLIRKINLRQPVIQWEYMLRYERDVLAQFQAIDTLQKFPSHQTRTALQEAIENEHLFYRVRCRAAFCLAEVDNRLADTWCGPPVLLNLFTKLYGCKADAMIPRAHNFSITSWSLQTYFLMHALPLAMSRLRGTGGVLVPEVHRFIINLIKLNDNSFNRYSDDFYRATLIRALATNIVYADAKIDCMKPIGLNREMNDTVAELTHALNMDNLKPSFCRVVAISCLYGLFQLQKFGHIPLDPEVFMVYTKPKLYSKLRQAAFTWLVRLLPLTRSDIMNYVFLKLLDSAKNDSDPSIRDHIATELNKHPPVHFNVRHKFNFQGVDRVLWAVICDPNAEPRIRCLFRDLYYHMYGTNHKLGSPLPPEYVRDRPLPLRKTEVIRNEQIAWTHPDYETSDKNPFAITNYFCVMFAVMVKPEQKQLTSTRPTPDASQCSFVASDLEKRIRESSRMSEQVHREEDSPTPLCSSEGSLSLSPVSLTPDPSVLLGIEAHAKVIATELDVLMRDLRGSLHGVSDLTREYANCYLTSISTSCDSVDAVIKSTYTMLAKTEELMIALKGKDKLQQQIKQLKRLVDMFESHFTSDEVASLHFAAVELFAVIEGRMAAENSETHSNDGNAEGLTPAPVPVPAQVPTSTPAPDPATPPAPAPVPRVTETDRTPPTSETELLAKSRTPPKGVEQMSAEKAEKSPKSPVPVSAEKAENAATKSPKKKKKKRSGRKKNRSTDDDKTPSSASASDKRKLGKKKSATSQEYGESLEECTDRDWHSADPAYNSELINLKKKANKVTVFSANSNTKIVREGKGRKSRHSSPSPGNLSQGQLTDVTNVEINIDPNSSLTSDKLIDAKADAIGKLVAGVVNMYLKDRRKDAVELEVRLHTKDGVNVDISQEVKVTTPTVAEPPVVPK